MVSEMTLWFIHSKKVHRAVSRNGLVENSFPVTTNKAGYWLQLSGYKLKHLAVYRALFMVLAAQ